MSAHRRSEVALVSTAASVDPCLGSSIKFRPSVTILCSCVDTEETPPPNLEKSDVSDSALRWRPDELVHLELKADVEFVG